MKLRLLLAGLLLLVTPIFAQDQLTSSTLTDEELALVEEIQALYDQFNELDGIGMDLVQVIDQLIDVNGEPISQSITIDIKMDSLLADGATVAFSADAVQSIDLGVVTGDFNFSMVYVDDEIYVKVMAEDGLFAGAYPEGWLKGSESPEAQELIGSIDVETLNQFAIAFTPDMVKAISTIDVTEEVEADRAIFVSLFPEALKQQGFADEIARAIYADDSDEFIEIMDILLENAAMDLIYYLDDAGQLSRIDMMMNIMGDLSDLAGVDNFTLDQTLTQTATYHYYDEVPVITAPEIE